MAPRPLAQESWDALFDFLDPDRARGSGPDRDRLAEARCAEILRKLGSFFAGRQRADADDLAMEVLLRVAARCREVDVAGHSDRIGYFYGVARNLLHETYRTTKREAEVMQSARRELLQQAALDEDAWQRKEAVNHCLDHCLAGLDGRARHLVLRYYDPGEAGKAAFHRALAGEFGKSVNALRIEVHRLRRALFACVSRCLTPPGRRGAAAP